MCMLIIIIIIGYQCINNCPQGYKAGNNRSCVGVYIIIIIIIGYQCINNCPQGYKAGNNGSCVGLYI